MKTELWSIGLVLLAGLTGSLGPIMLKKAAGRISLKPLKIKNLLRNLKNYYLISGFLFYGFATIMFVPALKGGELSVLYPLVSVTYIWVILWSIKLLKEKMNIMKWAGILLVVAGVVFIGLGA